MRAMRSGNRGKVRYDQLALPRGAALAALGKPCNK
jgi:hypothetical protein